MSLPKGFKRLEYIQSSGTQYIATDFVSNQDTRVVMDAQFTSTPAALVALFGARGSASSQHFVYYNNNQSKFSLRFGGGTENFVSVTATDRNMFDLNKNTLSVGSKSITATSATFSAARDMYLFAIHDAVENAAGEARYLAAFKLYSCQIYDNGLLERDYIPAMLANGEVGLYDRVFHEFYRNAGTGEFVAGPEMVHEGYTELEYIESDGTQELHTGVYPSADLSSEITLVPSASGMAENAILGAAWSLNGFFLMFYQNMLRFHSSGASVDVSNFDKTGKNNLKCSPKQFVVNGQPYTLSGTGTDVQQEIVLFYVKDLAGNNFNPPKRGVYTLYSCRFDKSNNPVRVYIPMLHPSGVAGLWDSVNERFYASATTTDFIAGPEAQTVPKSPANFRVESETDTLVTLAWDASDKALGYRLYRSGQLLADTTETSVSVTVEPFAGAVFTLTAYNENGEGAGSTLTYFKAPDDPILFLITDRTQQDVTERNPKGYYAASDLNRVGYAVEYLANIIRGYGYTLEVHIKTDWTDEDWKLTGKMVKYLQSLNNLKAVFSTLVELPETMEKIDYRDANNIEQLLLTIDETIVRVVAGFTRANAYGLRSGAKGLPASQSDRGRNWGQLDAMETTWANWQLATWYLLLYGNLKAEGVVE